MSNATVEVDILSGAPNPAWTLSEADAAALLARLAELPAAPARARPGGLGYRGIVVRLTEAPERVVHIHGGLVESSDGRSSAFLRDPDRSLERWLVGTGRDRLAGELLDAIDADLCER